MPDDVDNWADELKNIIPDINVKVCKSRNDALKEMSLTHLCIGSGDVAFQKIILFHR